ncbi:MAG: glycosyltransferase family 4 protein [Carboxylicivirga sp.]|jgi:glycosyltransferase involved in cell wall biosynthesis|nr:glycosyltransferase family 4 protein [Carboxylicivirga sp.]
MTKTIFIVSHHNSNWGAERSTCSNAAYLKSLGYRVILIIPKEGKILEIIRDLGLEYRSHYFRGWINGSGTKYIRAIISTFINICQLFILSFKLRREGIKPDLIYSNTLVHGFGILLSKLYRVPHLQHIRENIDVFGMKFNWGYNTTLNYINRSSQKIICTCNAIKGRYINDFSEDKMNVVHNGIPITAYKKPKPNPKIFSMVYTGRLYMDKRPLDVVKLIKELVESGTKDIKLDIYGSGSMEKELVEFVILNKLEQYIKFKGFQKSIDYSQYYVGFLPSEFEAFARTTLEYMMNGLAVVGTNTGGTAEQIENGKTGFLYSPGSISEMKAFVIKLYNNRDLCFKLGENGYNRVSKLFSQESYVKKLSHYFIENIVKKN